MQKASVLVGTFVLLVAILLGVANNALAQDAVERPRVLVIVESDSRLPVARLLLSGIEAGLGPQFTAKSEIFIEYLDMLRFNNPKELDPILALITERYKGIKPDAIGVLGSNALAFVLDNRDTLAPGVPIVFGAFGDAGLKAATTGRNAANTSGVLSTFDSIGSLELALKVQPDAPEIVVIAGSGNLDRQMRATFEAAIVGHDIKVPIRLLPETTIDAYFAQVRSLDPKAIVLLLSVSLDTAENRFLPIQFAKALAEASPAPVWSLFETQIGQGPVGGSVEDLTATGRDIGAMLRLAVAGSPLPELMRATATPTVDWRAMRRHGLDLGLLPENSRILFYEPTLWERYRSSIVALAAVVLAQSATILALLFQRRRYLRAQASLDLERRQLIHVSRNLRLGQLSASLAHEINQPLAAIQANAEAGTRIADKSPPDIAEIAAIFHDINDDVRRAASTIASLRRLMIKGEVAMEQLDLNDIVRATLPLAKSELAANGTKVRPALAPDRVEMNGNGPQLQQIVLNLVLNASEAMAELPEETRVVNVTTERLASGEAVLTVEDAGPGVPPGQREEAFRPFTSSKPLGLGVGLAICRSIAQAHGGSLAFADAVGPGARVVLTLPGPGAPA